MEGASNIADTAGVSVVRLNDGMQTEFAMRWETEVFYGGQAGGGKSHAILIDALRGVGFREYKAVIFRRTYPDLEELLHRAIQIYTAYGLWARYNAQSHTFTFPSGAWIKFRHINHAKDVYKYQGHQFDYIGFDELPQFPRFVYLYMFSRLRGNPNSPFKRYIRGTGNPDGEGMLWVKERFIDSMDPLTTGWFITGRGDADISVPIGTKESVSRCFVPCIRSENEFLNLEEYEAHLNLLPEAQRQALKLGQWTLPDRPEQLIQGRWIEMALGGKAPFNGVTRWAIGMDYAREGGDKTVILTGRGNQPRRFEWWPRTSTVEASDLLAKRLAIYGDTVVAGIDTIGPGAGVIDAIRSYHPKFRSQCFPMDHKDHTFDERYRKAFKGRYKFDNLRTQMLWKLREDFEYKRIDLSFLQSSEGYFDGLNMLTQELLAHTYEITGAGHISIISKDDLRKPNILGRSPDFSDALALWNFVRDKRSNEPAIVEANKKLDYGLEKFIEHKTTTTVGGTPWV
jgi:hypothetical protein